MPQSRTPRPVLPHLDPPLLAVALTSRQVRAAERFVALTLGLLQVLGLRTATQVLLGLGHGDQDWSAAYRLLRRQRLDLEAGRRAVVAGVLCHVPRPHPLVVVLDATQLPRTSSRLVGWADSMHHDPPMRIPLDVRRTGCHTGHRAHRTVG